MIEQPFPLVSLIVVTYNSVDLLPRFLAALATTEYAPYELIIVDNNSTDGTLEYLAGQNCDMRVIASPHNEGFGRACNRGAALTQGAILVFLNPDVAVIHRCRRVERDRPRDVFDGNFIFADLMSDHTKEM